ncbi:MAG: TIGR00159 family protein [Syntrophus sp. (in: bacteria)]|nr:TIGR00159 family protein [Syntrophus sp. (in: bacteria)]
MITSLRWQDVLDIIVVAFIIYRTFLLVKGTRATQLIVGIIVIFFVFYLSKKLELFALGWILNNFASSIILVIVVVFQNEIRQVLLALGRSPFFKKITYVKETLFFDELSNACTVMGSKKIGALIVIEREIGLEEFMEIGVRLDAEVNAELILSVFQYASPLHDGAMIVRDGRIRAASCILPLAMKDTIDKELGTRHRAAIGITEVTDAVALVVSEEKGQISYAYKGELHRDVHGDTLKKALLEFLR